MPIWHGDRGKRKTGGAVTKFRKKRKFELGSNPLMTRLGPEKKRTEKTKGGLTKLRALAAEYANVYDPASKATKRVKITDIIENPASPHFVRRGIITKGAVVETELGLARVRSRPSQHGVVNAIILEKEKS
jgi:small subunit ribosomal protein S8e